MDTLLAFGAKATTGFAAAVLESVLEPELPGPVNAADWPQAASVASAAQLKPQRTRREAIPVRARRWLRLKLILRLPQRLSH